MPPPIISSAEDSETSSPANDQMIPSTAGLESPVRPQILESGVTNDQLHTAIEFL